jgi:cell division septation protein DedD
VPLGVPPSTLVAGATRNRATAQPKAGVSGTGSATAAEPTPARGRFLQLGVFRDAARAEALRARAAQALEHGGGAVQARPRGALFRVLAGPFGDSGLENAAARKVRGELGIRALHVSE